MIKFLAGFVLGGVALNLGIALYGYHNMTEGQKALFWLAVEARKEARAAAKERKNAV